MTALSPSLQWNPHLDDWIRVDASDTITVRTGKVELGQGITTALALIAADELDVALERIRIETADSARPPNEFMTVGSMSIETSGAAVRQAAAEARKHLLVRGARLLGVAEDELRVEDGVISGRGRTVSYWELMRGQSFGVDVTGATPPKTAAQRRLTGKPATRIDLPELVFGARRFVQDLRPSGVVYGRVLRPPAPRFRLRSLDAAAVEAVGGMPGVLSLVHDGSFLGVIAEREEQALAALDALRAAADFEELASLPRAAELGERLHDDLAGSYPLQDGVPREAPVPPMAAATDAAFTLRARYERPFLMHGSIGPSAALAFYGPDGLEVFCASQGVAVLAPAIASVLELPLERVRLVHVPGPGCYGQNGSDDAALDAALLARALPGRPVFVQWSRQDEHAFEPYGSATRIDLCATLDANGKISSWSHDVYSYSHLGRAISARTAGQLIAAQTIADALPIPPQRPMLAPEVGMHRNAVPIYALPAPRIVKHLAAHPPLRTSSLRSLGAYCNVFAIESAMDELAQAARQDPLSFRLAHLADARGKAVLEAGAERSGFRGPKPAASEQRPRGRGLGFARYENHKTYAAVFVELEVDLASFQIQLLRAVIAADAGHIVDPDGLANQLEGGFIQAASWTLKEQVSFDASRITSLDWQSYPILTFEEVPEVEVVLLDQPEQRALGAGEASTGPTPAAIANAVFDACGARLRGAPFTPERLRAALYA
ncbi:MAG TPA: molybdopterin cofactor-binding domain-containing protein [Polyangiales bacterium]|nr:molybdopterin cofactor-binding domain-containing protein [Polyangiales bacterium]